MTDKRCTGCGLTKPLAQFRADKRGRFGRYSRCRECERVYSKEYSRTHSEERQAWRDAHKKQTAAYDAARYRARKTEIRAGQAKYAKRYNQINKDERREYTRRWRRKNPSKYLAQKQRRRSREVNAQGVLTGVDIEAQIKRQKGKCFYCRAKKKLSVEHVKPLSRGGSNSPDNIVMACGSCNSAKQARLPHEWPEGGRLL